MDCKRFVEKIFVSLHVGWFSVIRDMLGISIIRDTRFVRNRSPESQENSMPEKVPGFFRFFLDCQNGGSAAGVVYLQHPTKRGRVMRPP